MRQPVRAVARCVALALIAAVLLSAQNEPEWVRKSDENTQVVLRLQAAYDPEDASVWLRGLDQQVRTISPDTSANYRRDAARARDELKARFASEKDPRVRQDLAILIELLDRRIATSLLQQRFFIPYSNVSSIALSGISGLLDNQVAPGRREAAVTRLRRYAGLEPGYAPLAVAARQLIEARLKNNPSLLGPAKAELERDLSSAEEQIASTPRLFESYKLEGWQPAWTALKQQLTDYQRFLRSAVAPRTRTSFREPPEIYADQLINAGVDYSDAEITGIARAEAIELRSEMQRVAARVAAQRKWNAADYRHVLRRLGDEQIADADILPLYRSRLAAVETLIRANRLITLPSRPEILRSTRPTDFGSRPQPFLLPPPLVDNRREMGEFVVPTAMTRHADFTSPAASWALTCEDGRPGRELQYDEIVQRGVSQARVFYTSSAIDGWAIYAGWFMSPFLPDDGRLIELQRRLLRAEAAILASELQEGAVSPDDAARTLQNDVVVSEELARREAHDRLTHAPAGAVAVYARYRRLREIRAAAEKELAGRFDVQRFHDFLLGHPLLPARLLREAVLTEFVPEH